MNVANHAPATLSRFRPFLPDAGAGVLNRIAAPPAGKGDLVAGGGDAELAAEGAGHVALVREARFLRRFGRSATGNEELPGKPHAALEKVGVRRDARLAREAAQELEAAHPG